MIRRTPIAVLLLVLMALRSLLPSGFMIDSARAADGAFELVICTSTGPAVINVDADHTLPAPSQPQHADQELCPFAAGGAATLAAEEPRTLAAEAEYAALTYAVRAQLLAVTPQPGATSARGPPASSI